METLPYLRAARLTGLSLRQIGLNGRHLFFCVATGLWAGLAIGFTTEYFTSNAYR
jgi:inorganic pyrophosphatase